MGELQEFRVTLAGQLSEVWKVRAHDEADAVQRVRHGDGLWIEADWDGEPSGLAVPAHKAGESHDEASCCECSGAHPCADCPILDGPVGGEA